MIGGNPSRSAVKPTSPLRFQRGFLRTQAQFEVARDVFQHHHRIVDSTKPVPIVGAISDRLSML